MRRILAHAMAAFALLGALPAVAHDGLQLAMSLPGPYAGDAAKPAAAIEQASTAGMANEPGLFSDLPKPSAALVAPPSPPPPAITLLLKADLTAQKLTVVEGGKVLHVWAISSGRRGYATATGISDRRG